jgi:hypothetical protein
MPAARLPDDAFLCERCGYVLDGLSPAHCCPECGRPVAASHPDQRAGSPFQRGVRHGSVDALLAAVVRPRLLFAVCRIDAASSRRLRDRHLLVAALVSAGGALVAHGAAAGPADLGVVLFALVGLPPLVYGLLRLLTAVERRGIMLWGRVHGRRVSAAVAHTVVGHASAGWVMGALLVALSHPLGALVRHVAVVRPAATYEVFLLAPLLLPMLAGLCGLVWFETLVYVGVRACAYANRPGVGPPMREADAGPGGVESAAGAASPLH